MTRQCTIITKKARYSIIHYPYSIHMHITGKMDEQKWLAVTTQANISMAAYTLCDYSTDYNMLTSAWYSASRHTKSQQKFFLILIHIHWFFGNYPRFLTKISKATLRNVDYLCDDICQFWIFLFFEFFHVTPGWLSMPLCIWIVLESSIVVAVLNRVS